MKSASPLRYPGGKWRLGRFFERLVLLNFSSPPIYVEPYAGGASLALSLLFSGIVSQIFLNDLDPAIFAFWHSTLRHTDALIKLIDTARITPSTWKEQKRVYAAGPDAGKLRLGFATFFLNRTNHSGILNAGMIGGKGQSGEWKLDARFNRSDLISRIRRVAKYRDRIHLSNEDALHFIRRYRRTKRKLIYLDPPYYGAGKHLYMNTYRAEDHANIRESVLSLRCNWVVSYDDVRAIRTLYINEQSRRVELLHTARTARMGKELLFFSPAMRIPKPQS